MTHDDLTDLELRTLINTEWGEMLRERVIANARKTMENADRYARVMPTDFGYIDRRKALQEKPGDRPAPGWREERTQNMARTSVWKLTK